ncbi:MAG: hypothetical protein Q4G63_12150 [Bacteroidia bacterium]|nr:hypothetical protein [Bacteroidia bacterium]
MVKTTNINKPLFLAVSILAIFINGFLTLLNLSEFYIVGILKQTDGYPFGSEGSLPYYYNTAELYSIVNLIWGVIILSILIFTIIITIKGQRKKGFIIFGATLLLTLVYFFHGQIGT